MEVEQAETVFNSLGKRLRDEDAAEMGSNFSEPPVRNYAAATAVAAAPASSSSLLSTLTSRKKQRKLAFRPPTLGQSSTLFVSQHGTQQLPFAHAQPGPNTPTLTPADSPSDSSNAEIRSPPLGPSITVPSTVFTPVDDDVDMGMDEDLDEPTTPQYYGRHSPKISPKSQTPTRSSSREQRSGRLAPIVLGTPNQTLDLSTRVPTPIYGHFSTHAGSASGIDAVNNGNNAHAAALGNGPSSAGANGSPLPHHSRSNHYNIALYPHHLQERKMPSPITEDFAHETNGHNGTSGTMMPRSGGASSSGMPQYLTMMQNPMLAGLHVDEDMAMSPASPTATLTPIPSPANPAAMSRSSSIGAGPRRRSDAISGNSPADASLVPVDLARQNSNGNAYGASSGSNIDGNIIGAHEQEHNVGDVHNIGPGIGGGMGESGSSGSGLGVGTSGFGKTSFHMGYKADCKMCQDRVPGHFNHITHARA